MTDIFDYLYWRGDISTRCAAFHELDGAILARLAYLPFERIFPNGTEQPLPLTEAATRLLAVPDLEEQVTQPADLRLLKTLLGCDRFCHAELVGFTAQRDEETQFSALALRLQAGELIVAFRGTDNTLVGWKEDFNMGFVCPVPAQELAVQYLERTAAGCGDTLRLCGHSKGGNLAVYAAAFCTPAVQERITSVYNYDGPGFDETVLARAGYRAVCGRVHTFVPQSSVVGMLLGHEEEYTIVHSERMGLMQHDIYSWEVERDRFVHLETVTNSSRFIDYTLKAWIAGMDVQQRERFVDAIYGIMKETNAQTLRELNENRLDSAKQVLRSIRGLDEQTRGDVTHALGLLLRSTKVGFSQTREVMKTAE